MDMDLQHFMMESHAQSVKKNNYLWILSFLFQLLMVTMFYVILIPLQVNGTSSPLNITIMYIQLIAVVLKLNGTLHIRVVCLTGETFTDILLTILDFFMLDFFRQLLPPLCISASFKAINTLLFDYVIAIYPLMLTAFIYLCIKLYDGNNKIIVSLSSPIRRCFTCINPTWNPRRKILNTFATFCLLSYTKFLFVSINLLAGVQIYNSHGKTGSKVLLYDPTIRFFHSEHIPYVVLASTVIVIFIFIPPLFLLLYPITALRRFLQAFKVRRDIINHIEDIFQGWNRGHKRLQVHFWILLSVENLSWL